MVGWKPALNPPPACSRLGFQAGFQPTIRGLTQLTTGSRHIFFNPPHPKLNMFSEM